MRECKRKDVGISKDENKESVKLGTAERELVFVVVFPSPRVFRQHSEHSGRGLSPQT